MQTLQIMWVQVALTAILALLALGAMHMNWPLVVIAAVVLIFCVLAGPSMRSE